MNFNKYLTNDELVKWFFGKIIAVSFMPYRLVDVCVFQFAGYSSDSLAGRILDAKCHVVITAGKTYVKNLGNY